MFHSIFPLLLSFISASCATLDACPPLVLWPGSICRRREHSLGWVAFTNPLKVGTAEMQRAAQTVTAKDSELRLRFKDWPCHLGRHFISRLSVYRTCLKCRRHRRHRFNSWVGKIPWRRAWQPTPVFLPGESHGWRSPAGYSPRSHKELNTTEATEHAYTYTVTPTPLDKALSTMPDTY